MTTEVLRHINVSIAPSKFISEVGGQEQHFSGIVTPQMLLTNYECKKEVVMSEMAVKLGPGEKIPVIDCAGLTDNDVAVRNVTATSMREAFEDFGFIYLQNHGIPQTVIDELFARGTAFFDLPQNTKAQAGGYRGPGLTGLDPTKPTDVKERFRAPYDSNVPSGYWPEWDPRFREAISVFHEAGLVVLHHLMHGVALSLGLPEEYFDSTHQPHSGAVMLLHYPPITEPLSPGQLRSGAHTDFGTMTLLFHYGSSEGLEIQRPDGTWLHAPSRPGAAIVNVGDLLTRWTNGQLRSVLHRVVPPQGQGAHRSRYAVTLFYEPRHEVIISCLETCQSPTKPAVYPPITVGERLAQRRRENMRTGY
jgi:isopenicillin N synthase-like dioxygenase